MRVIINFTEDKPHETIITDAVSNNSLKGILIKTLDRLLLFRFYGFNVLKKGKCRYYYKPFVSTELKDITYSWYEVKRKPISITDIAKNSLVISLTKDEFINKLLKQRRDEYTRKTDKGRD